MLGRADLPPLPRTGGQDPADEVDQPGGGGIHHAADVGDFCFQAGRLGLLFADRHHMTLHEQTFGAPVISGPFPRGYHAFVVLGVPLRAGIVLLDEDRLALIERTRDSERYYLLPGGMVNDGESPERAAVREAVEELGLVVEVGPLVAEVTVMRGEVAARQLYYLATTVSGEFGTGEGEEFTIPVDQGRGTYRAVRRTLATCRGLDVRPRALVEAILSSGIPSLLRSPLIITEQKAT